MIYYSSDIETKDEILNLLYNLLIDIHLTNEIKENTDEENEHTLLQSIL